MKSGPALDRAIPLSAADLEEELRFHEELLQLEQNIADTDGRDEVVFEQAEHRRHALFLKNFDQSSAKRRYSRDAGPNDPWDLLTCAFPRRSRAELEVLRHRVLRSCIQARSFWLAGVISKSTASRPLISKQIAAARGSVAVLIKFFEEQEDPRLATFASKTAATTISRLRESNAMSNGAKGKISARRRVREFLAALSASLQGLEALDFSPLRRKYPPYGCLRYPAQGAKHRHYPDPATMLMYDLLVAFGDPEAKRHFDLAFSVTKWTFFREGRVNAPKTKANMKDALSRLINRNPGLRVGSWLGDD